MAGTLQGRVDCFSNMGSIALNSQEMYKAVFDSLSASARHTRIAWFKGDVGGNVPLGSGRGQDYHDGTNPMGTNAFSVFEFSYAAKKWYLHLHYSDGASGTLGGGGTLDGATSLSGNGKIGFQMALAQDSGGVDANPWAGSVLNNGTDTKTGSWWTQPGGGRLFMFPRHNSTGGGYATSKNNLAQLAQTNSTTSCRYSILFDDDNLLFTMDDSTPGGVSMAACGLYTPRPDIVVARPGIMLTTHTFSDAGFLLALQVFGPTGTGSTTRNGGIRGMDTQVGASLSTDVLGAVLDDLDLFAGDTNLLLNRAMSPASYDEWALNVGAYEAANGYGYLGQWDWIRHVYGPNNGDTNQARTRAYFGTVSANFKKWSIPWDGTTTPGTVVLRQGVTVLWRLSIPPRCRR